MIDVLTALSAAQTMILEACSHMPPTVALMKPLQRVAQPAGNLIAAFRSIIAIRDTSLYLMTSAAVSWASTVCFTLLLFGQGRHVRSVRELAHGVTAYLVCILSICQNG